MAIDDWAFFLITTIGINLLMVWSVFGNPAGGLVKMFPDKKPSDYDEFIRKRSTEQFKKHKKKWTKKFLLIALGSLISSMIIAVIIKDMLIAYIANLVIVSIWSGRVRNKEMQERRNLNK